MWILWEWQLAIKACSTTKEVISVLFRLAWLNWSHWTTAICQIHEESGQRPSFRSPGESTLWSGWKMYAQEQPNWYVWGVLPRRVVWTCGREHFPENTDAFQVHWDRFRDPADICKRSISELSWHSDNPSKIAASYAINRFQQTP